MAEIRQLLDDVIEKEVKNLDSLTDSEERSQVIKDLVQLHKLRIEEIKAETEAEDKRERRDMDSKKIEADLAFKEKQMAAQNEQGDKEFTLKKREVDCKEAERVREETSLKQQAKDNMIDRCVKVGIALTEIVVPLAFYGIWMKQGFKFEETGSFTSTTFKNLFNRFRPTK